MFTPPMAPAIKAGSAEKQKATLREHKKQMPAPTGSANQPVRYGTSPQQDKMQAALRLLGAGQQFPGGAGGGTAPAIAAPAAPVQGPVSPPSTPAQGIPDV